eukprot:9736119-Ditylum_brightwellii.AAC.1
MFLNKVEAHYKDMVLGGKWTSTNNQGSAFKSTPVPTTSTTKQHSNTDLDRKNHKLCKKCVSGMQLGHCWTITHYTGEHQGKHNTGVTKPHAHHAPADTIKTVTFDGTRSVSYTHLRAHETLRHL